jgi:hypothetical protein
MIDLTISHENACAALTLAGLSRVVTIQLGRGLLALSVDHQQGFSFIFLPNFGGNTCIRHRREGRVTWVWNPEARPGPTSHMLVKTDFYRTNKI